MNNRKTSQQNHTFKLPQGVGQCIEELVVLFLLTVSLSILLGVVAYIIVFSVHGNSSVSAQYTHYFLGSFFNNIVKPSLVVVLAAQAAKWVSHGRD